MVKLRVSPKNLQLCIIAVAHKRTARNNYDVSTQSSLGLRDRKRLETRLRLEDAAVTLVLQNGLEHSTIDAISELADVSPRTFFNYFESKDAAILGLREVKIEATELAAHCDRVPKHGLLASVIHLLLTVMGPPSTRRTMRADRQEILRRYPQLLTIQLAQFTQLTTVVTEAVTALVARDGRFANDSPAAQAASADIVLALCGSAVRVVVKEWAEANQIEASDAVEQRELRALSLAREVCTKLS
jgi:AcrR family transcriptional regulator